MGINTSLGRGCLPKKAVWDSDFIRAHDTSGPRYTSYPTALQFHEEFSEQDYAQALARSNASRKPLSLYVHLPFCGSLCYYCACNKFITQSADKKSRYLAALIMEIRHKARGVPSSRPVYQMHWGGGTPTFFSDAELTQLWFEIGRHFNLVSSDRAEYSIEIDPRTVNPERLQLLKGLGFNRISLGIQDFDPWVQRTINRIQRVEDIRKLVNAAKALRFRSVNFDLIYGLPYQTRNSVRKSLQTVVELAPDRISLFNYAHLPERFKSQRLLPEEALPDADEKLGILCDASNYLVEQGYCYIGMDHFAKPDDELAIAQAEGRLHRNFQGYTTYKEADLIGLGVSAISSISSLYCQNSKSLNAYQQRALENASTIDSGFCLTLDDEIRRQIIMSLLCQNSLSLAGIETQFGIRFRDYFKPEVNELEGLVAQGLLQQTPNGYQVTDKGRLVVRKLCMVFDSYLPGHIKNGLKYSKVI